MAAQTIKKIFRLYLDGFRSMTVGKTLWAIILVKLFILFAILKEQRPYERRRTDMQGLPSRHGCDEGTLFERGLEVTFEEDDAEYYIIKGRRYRS